MNGVGGNVKEMSKFKTEAGILHVREIIQIESRMSQRNVVISTITRETEKNFVC
jgi:hypothetical protein